MGSVIIALDVLRHDDYGDGWGSGFEGFSGDGTGCGEDESKATIEIISVCGGTYWINACYKW